MKISNQCSNPFQEVHGHRSTGVTIDKRLYVHRIPNMTMEQRTKLTNRICNELWKQVSFDKLTPADIPPMLLVSDRYKVYGCKADKVGGTNLQRIFYILNGLTNETDTGKIKTSVARKTTCEFFAKSKPNFVKDVIPRLKAYTSVMFVRHPLERVVSAYRDNKPNGLFAKFRKNSTKPTFNEYIDILLLNEKKGFAKPNRQIYKLCHPCQLKYDFIASLENYNDDMTIIFKAIGAENVVTIPKREETGYRQRKSSEVVEHFYKDIPFHKISKLESIYELDYHLFGYEKFYQ